MDRLIEIFLMVFNMSLTATIVMLFVIILRKIFNRMPKSIFYALWSVVLFRFACPTSFASALSVFNFINIENAPINNIIITFNQAKIRELTAMKNSISQSDSALSRLLPSVFESISNGFWIYYLATLIWIIGIIVILMYNSIAFLRMKSKLADSTKLMDNIYETDVISSPFVFGIIRPKIILPVGLAADDTLYIVRHEMIHIRRRDHIVKVLSFAILSFHWFNPCAWLTLQLLNNDLEMSCDEKALKNQNYEERIRYSNSLLRMSLHRRTMAGNKLAFGKSGVKTRISNLLYCKFPVKGVIILFSAFIIMAGLSLIANPKPLMSNSNFEKYKDYESFFGTSIYATISYKMSENERDVVQPVLGVAEKVFSYTGEIGLADKSVGELKRYYYLYNAKDKITSVNVDLKLITAKINQDDGIVWVSYSVSRYNDAGTLVNGSADVLSYWQIEENDGVWVVVDVIEPP